MPPVPYEVYDPLYPLINRLHSLPPDFPAFIPPPELTEQETFAIFNARQDEIDQISKRLDIASWVAINQMIPLPIEHWIGRDPWQTEHGLSEALRRAIVKEVEEVARARDNSRREAERKWEMEKMNANAKLQFPRDPGSSTAHLFK